MSCSDTVDPDYNERLKSSIKQIFRSYVKPHDVLIYFHKYDFRVLTEDNLDQVKAATNNRGDRYGADELLDRLSLYQGWFECTQQVLKDPEVKLDHVAMRFTEIKERLDNNKGEEEKKLKEKNRELEEQLRQKDQRILELEAERGKAENADITQEEDRELTGNAAVRELEKVTGAIKAELEQKDQLISDLTTKNTRQHNEIQSLQQEKNALLDSMQKRVLTKGGSAMQVVFDPSRSESVTLFNFFMTSWIHKYRPDFASKHGVPRCAVPANLKSAADFVTRYRFVCTPPDEYDLKSGKNEVTTSLQALHDAVNRWRDKDWSEDAIKWNLLGDVVFFFNICYSILTLLERHQTTELASFIIYTRDSISGMLDSLVDELGGWAHISSLLKENNSFRMEAERWAVRWASLLWREYQRRALST